MIGPLLTAVGVVLIAAGLTAGAAALTAGRTGRTGRASRTPSLLRRLAGSTRTDHTVRVGVAAGAAVGLLIWVLTGWAVAALILPAAAWTLPALLQPAGHKATIVKLEAMEEWTRNLAGVIKVGIGLEQALISSLRVTPEPIRDQVGTLVTRIEANTGTEDALRQFADDLNDRTGDQIAASLIIGARASATRLPTVLERLAATVAETVKDRRRVEADRAKSRRAARNVTIIISLVLGGLLFTGNQYMEPYFTDGLGQILFAVLLASVLGCLLWMKQIVSLKPPPRFLGTPTARQARPQRKAQEVTV